MKSHQYKSLLYLHTCIIVHVNTIGHILTIVHIRCTCTKNDSTHYSNSILQYTWINN